MSKETKSFRQTLEQARAKAAWEMIMENSAGSKYKTVVDGAPALIQSAGLGQAMAFYTAKDGRQYVDHVAQWVLGDGENRDKNKRASDLIKKITECDSRQYRRMTEEAMAITGWLKRFTAAK